MNKISAVLGLCAGTLALTACSTAPVAIPDPTPGDYAYWNMMIATHPGQNCYMSWGPGHYITTCYAYGVHPLYSAKLYPPPGCTCPAADPKPKNYVPAKPIPYPSQATVTPSAPKTPSPTPKTAVNTAKPVPLPTKAATPSKTLKR